MMMSPGLRKFALTTHVTSSVGWLGSVAAFLALAIAGISSEDSQIVRAAYLAMHLTTWFVIVPFSFASFLTGLIESLGTPWGLFRHYWVVTKLVLTVLATSIFLLAGSWAQAHLEAKRISSTYNVVQFLDILSGRAHYVLMEGLPGQIPNPSSHSNGVTIADHNDLTRRGWGTYLFDPHSQRAVSFSAPHPKDDLETADEAIEAYLTLRAHTLLIAGADRDQNTALAPCAQSARPYFESDMAHTAESVFQMAFEEIYSSDAVTWHLQFHGNSTCLEDVFLSNGVAAAPAMLSSLAANIEAASTDVARGGPVLRTGVFDATGGCAARGTDNMQMRFGSGLPHASICEAPNVPVAPSRLIHIEQRRDARRAPSDPAATPGRNRAVVISGILATFS